MDFWNGITQFLKYLASWVPVSAPGALPVQPIPSSPPLLDLVARIILAYNNSKSYFVVGTSWSVPAKGVILHKINATEAQAISTMAQASAKQFGLPLTYVLACLAVESVMDPNCINGNLIGSNTVNSPLGYDDGIAQLKLRYLLGSAHGVTDAASAQTFAFDVSKAIPYFCSLMALHVANANKVLEGNTSSQADVRLRNPLVYATGSYNFGETGMQEVFSSGAYPNHCASVVSDEKYFADKLGVASVFAGLPT